MVKIDAFIPARGGSSRIPRKNIAMLSGHPLIAYTIAAAKQAGIFRGIYVSTDDADIGGVALKYKADEVILRPGHMAKDGSADIEWLRHAIGELSEHAEYFAILRPTSPFRRPETIRRAWEKMKMNPYADSLRAVRPCKEHPGKMWVHDEEAGVIMPLVNYARDKNGQASYNLPYQNLPDIYVQSAALEIGHIRNPLIRGDVSGAKIIPFFMDLYEDCDINYPFDLEMARWMVEKGIVRLPEVTI